MPDSRRILDEKGKTVGVEQREQTRRVGADSGAHAGIETIIDVGQNEVEVGLGAARDFQLTEPFLLDTARKVRAVIQEHVALRGRRGRVAEQLQGVEPELRLVFGAYVQVHGSETRWVAETLEGLKIKLGEIDAIPVMPRQQLLHSGGNG